MLEVDEQVEVDVVDEFDVEIEYDEDDEDELVVLGVIDGIIMEVVLDEMDELDYVDIDDEDDEVVLFEVRVDVMVDETEFLVGERDVMLLTVVDDEVELMLISDEMGLDE